jgi:hypothetical protein
VQDLQKQEWKIPFLRSSTFVRSLQFESEAFVGGGDIKYKDQNLKSSFHKWILCTPMTNFWEKIK